MQANHPEPERRRAVGTTPPMLGGVPLTNEECRLRWTRRLFADEARLVAASGDEAAQTLLLRDAFVDPWIADSLPHNPINLSGGLTYLADNVEHLPEGPVPPRLTYQQRRASDLDGAQVDETLLSLFVSLVNDLISRGYFARRLTDGELTGRSPSRTDGAIDLLNDDLGWRLMSWPLNRSRLTEVPPWGDDPFKDSPGTVDDDHLFDLIEVLHRYVARPRTIKPGWDDGFGDGLPDTYADFNPAVGRAIYRHLVNQLLEKVDAPLRLADDGQDVGLLVTITDEARTELLQTMARRSDPSTGDRVRHAISLFRSRGATEDDKRSAGCTGPCGIGRSVPG